MSYVLSIAEAPLGRLMKIVEASRWSDGQESDTAGFARGSVLARLQRPGKDGGGPAGAPWSLALESTDLRHWVSVTLPAALVDGDPNDPETPTSWVLPGALVAELARASGDARVRLEKGEGHVETTHELGSDPTVWPSLPELGQRGSHSRELVVDGERLSRAARLIWWAADIEGVWTHKYPAIAGVFLELLEKGTPARPARSIRMIATDGHRMAVVGKDAEGVEDEILLPARAAELLQHVEGDVRIIERTIRRPARLIGKHDAKLSWLTISTAEVKIELPGVVGAFPEYRSIVGEEPPYRIVVNRAQVVDLLGKSVAPDDLVRLGWPADRGTGDRDVIIGDVVRKDPDEKTAEGEDPRWYVAHRQRLGGQVQALPGRGIARQVALPVRQMREYLEATASEGVDDGLVVSIGDPKKAFWLGGAIEDMTYVVMPSAVKVEEPEGDSAKAASASGDEAGSAGAADTPRRESKRGAPPPTKSGGRRTRGFRRRGAAKAACVAPTPASREAGEAEGQGGVEPPATDRQRRYVGYLAFRMGESIEAISKRLEGLTLKEAGEFIDANKTEVRWDRTVVSYNQFGVLLSHLAASDERWSRITDKKSASDVIGTLLARAG